MRKYTTCIRCGFEWFRNSNTTKYCPHCGKSQKKAEWYSGNFIDYGLYYKVKNLKENSVAEISSRLKISRPTVYKYLRIKERGR